MVVLKTAAHETVWGGEKLLPYADGNAKKIGHLYSLCCEEGLETIILNGKYENQPFHNYFVKHKEQFGLGKYERFPLVIALVEANDNLSIQVHPDDLTAKEEENAPYGKNESWYFMEAPKSGMIYNGCLTDDLTEIYRKMETDELFSVIDMLSIEEGDYVYVEGGTLHALSAGSYLYEIEENSPWTYRMFDYNRRDFQGNKRELHIDKAIKALKPLLKSKAVKLGSGWIEERRYMLKKIEYAAVYRNESATLECITMIKGVCDAENLKVTTGMTVVLEPGEQIEGNIQLAMAARPK